MEKNEDNPVVDAGHSTPSSQITQPGSCLLDSLKNRLVTNMKTCEEVLHKLQEGKEPTEQDELDVDRLELSVKGLIVEVRENTRNNALTKENEMECADLQITSEDLLLSLRRKINSAKKNIRPIHPQANTNVGSRLPKLSISTFDGDFLKWYAFWDGFKSAVGDREDLTPVDKLCYLVDLLRGTALEAVENIEKTQSNYMVAVNILNERFGKPDLIIEAHYDALNDLKPARNDPKECRKVLNQIEGHLRVLQSLGEDINHNMFRSTIKRKFPKEIKGDLWLRIKSTGYTVSTLRDTLNDIISAKEEETKLTQDESTKAFTTETLLSTVPQLTDKKVIRQNQGNKRVHSRDNPGGSRPANEPQVKRPRTHDNPSNPQQTPLRACVFCKGNHYNEDCMKYPSVESRKAALGEKCHICLRPGHIKTECRIQMKTFCAHCKGRGHNRSLCSERTVKANETTTALSQSHGDTILQTATVTVMSDHGERIKTTRVLLDTGSQKSYVTAELADSLHLEAVEESCLTVYTFGQLEPKTIPTRLVNLQLKTLEGANIAVQAYVIPNITGMIPSFPQMKRGVQERYPELDMAKDTDTDCRAGLLIGNDYYHSLVTGDQIQVSNNLYVIKTAIGWILSGSTVPDGEKDELLVLTFVQSGVSGYSDLPFLAPDPPLREDNIKTIWELETIGIKDSPKEQSQEETINFFNKTTIFENGRYQVKWPWIEYPIDLPVNYGMSFGRLKGLITRSDSATIELYDEVLKDQLAKGIIEIVPDGKLPQTHPVHYLPHHCVIRKDKTTKLRVVYDASAKSKGHCSLNEYLFKGPLLLEDLNSLLLRFRNAPIGLTADIEKAFLQVGLQPEDRDVTRFLWLKDIAGPVSEENVVHFRFCRVPFGIISSPFLLAATIKYHLEKGQSPETAQLCNSLYVDNLVTGVTSPAEGFQLYQAAVNACSELSMNLRDWTTNSKELWELLPETHRVDQDHSTTVLGLKWDTINDTLSLSVDPTILVRPVSSKREILRTVASIFDPCGFVAPLLLPARLLLQNLWVKKYKWDTPLGDQEQKDWTTCAAPLSHIRTFELPRYHHPDLSLCNAGDKKIQLHCFTDASKDAYAAVVYIRCHTRIGTSVNIVMSRTRLRPVKDSDRMTIPKLELLGVTIGARLLVYLQQALQIAIDCSYLWTDSQIVIGWMKTGRLLPPFVSRRVSEIRSYPAIQIRYVKTTDNPADIATRGIFSPLPTLWTLGPDFLRQAEESWPGSDDGHPDFPDGETEQNSAALFVNVTTNEKQDETRPDEEGRIQGPSIHESDLQTPQHTTIPDVLPSQLVAITELQKEYFPKEVAGQPTPLMKSLGIFKDADSLLRCKGRLQNAMLPLDQKFPILLPKNAPFTSDLILKLHNDNKHVGTSHTLSLLRKRFWVPQGRAQVQKVLKQCKACIKYGGGPYKLPPMPPLPAERVRFCRPFLYTGLDYLGPLTVVNDVAAEKRWCCIFTCMASRAIRLEVVKDLSSEEFLLCLRRFVATQGAPALIVSDNATQFKLAADVLQAPTCKDSNISWHFIPELAPWHGGFYERLVGLVKHCLRRSLDKTTLNDTQLVTVFKEIETILNSRPLTVVGTNVEHVLSPSDFLSNCGTHPLPPPLAPGPPQITATRANLIEGWKRGMNAIEGFKEIFQDQYLTSLRERALCSHKQPRVLSHLQPKIGELVQLGDERNKHSNRAHWRVGRIKTLIQSADGQIRTAQVQLDSGQTFTRSIAHLYPLELSDEPTEPNLNARSSPAQANQSPTTEQSHIQQTHQAPHTNKELRSEHTQPTQQSITFDDPTASMDGTGSPTPFDALPQDQENDDLLPSSPQDVQDSGFLGDHTDQQNTHFEDNQDSPIVNDQLTTGNITSRPQRESARYARSLIRQWTQALIAHSAAINGNG